MSLKVGRQARRALQSIGFSLGDGGSDLQSESPSSMTISSITSSSESASYGSESASYGTAERPKTKRHRPSTPHTSPGMVDPACLDTPPVKLAVTVYHEERTSAKEGMANCRECIRMDNEMKDALKSKDQSKMTPKQLEDLAAEIAELDEDIKLCQDVYECLLR